MPPMLAQASGGELLLDTAMARRAANGRPDLLLVILVAIASAAIAVPALVVATGAGRIAYRDIIELPRRVVPRAELPPVEPLRLVDLTPEAARAYNAGQPFAKGAIPPARPFRFVGNADDLARATDCLAAAGLYEAGDDTTGERAVVQVVLNRLRHPAFPKSVCAVVFEGSQRATGCQFTFACDGALTRWHPTEAGWKRAREVAAAALTGAVDRDVGYATHYHTDWVVPYWQSSLDKIAAVHTHLFFRWSGWWGTPAAFDRHPSGGEPVIAMLGPISPAHGGSVVADTAAAPAVPFFGQTLKPLANDPDTFLTSVDPAQSPESYRAMAIQACGERPRCKVLGWSDPAAMAFALPLTTDAQAALSFSYLRDRPAGFEKALWNCSEFLKAPAGACMRKPTPAKSATMLVSTSDQSRLGADGDSVEDDDLGGVRRKTDARAPAATKSTIHSTDEITPHKAGGRTAPGD